jgi:hypothetical protein
MKTYRITWKEYGELRQWFCKALSRGHAIEKWIDPDSGYTLEMIDAVNKI